MPKVQPEANVREVVVREALAEMFLDQIVAMMDNGKNKKSKKKDSLMKDHGRQKIDDPKKLETMLPLHFVDNLASKAANDSDHMKRKGKRYLVSEPEKKKK